MAGCAVAHAQAPAGRRERARRVGRAIVGHDPLYADAADPIVLPLCSRSAMALSLHSSAAMATRDTREWSSMATWANSQPMPRIRSRRLPVTRWPGRSIRPSVWVSTWISSPGVERSQAAPVPAAPIPASGSGRLGAARAIRGLQMLPLPGDQPSCPPLPTQRLDLRPALGPGRPWTRMRPAAAILQAVCLATSASPSGQRGTTSWNLTPGPCGSADTRPPPPAAPVVRVPPATPGRVQAARSSRPC